MSQEDPSNERIAAVLERIADLLEAQDANPFRVRAYRHGATTVRETDASLTKLVRSGNGEALQDLPDIGPGLAGVITTYVERGRSPLLERLQGEMSPEKLFTEVPGIGKTLARRIASQLDVDTLEELEQAAHDGRLREVDGFGPKRVRSVRVSLAGMLSQAAQRRARQAASGEDPAEAEDTRPSVGTLLKVDAEYREQAEAGTLGKIAPRRFNPEGKAWLPILHTEREGWNLTALYSNTARAHELGKTHDWVVIYYDQDGQEDQATVVTGNRGILEGRRVVRGREPECRSYYKQKAGT